MLKRDESNRVIFDAPRIEEPFTSPLLAVLALVGALVFLGLSVAVVVWVLRIMGVEI